MSPWAKIAIRNLKKNGRRSLVTIIAIGVGFAGINVFDGFADYMYSGCRDGFIYGQAQGHLTIFKKGFLTTGRLDPTKYLIDVETAQAVKQICRSHPDVLLTSEQLYISGLLSNGTVSTIMAAIGRVPSEMEAIRSHAHGLLSKVKYFQGYALKDTETASVGLSSGLAEKLGLNINSTAIAMGPTIEGQINALDITVRQTFEPTEQALNDKVMLCPLAFTQSLYDTQSVDRIGVLLNSTEKTLKVKEYLDKAFKKKGLEVDVETWYDLSPLYGKTKKMFDLIFCVLFVIVFIMVVMSVVNTMTMAVVERTQEIGTLRALGVKRSGVVRLFAYESALLGSFGSILGLLLTIGNWVAFRIAEPTWIPPNFTKQVPLEIHLIPADLGVTMVFMIVLSVVAAILPARKAAKMNIVEAIGHV